MFRAGVSDCAPMAFGIAAWGLVVGAAMAKSGMGIPLAILMSVLVSAGTAQVAALPLIAAGAPMAVVWAAVACVSLRFLVFSWQYRPYFAHLPRHRRVLLSHFMQDTTSAMLLRRFPEPRGARGQVDYFRGAAAINCGVWQTAVMAGIFAGQAIPARWGVGFAGTMALLALACGQLRSRTSWAAALVAACAAVATHALPLRLHVVVAVAAALAVAAVARVCGRHAPEAAAS
ncbi:AzlC family ABC transporter permease [Ramlibacter humi]|nr:AzlC family ABC transporter permease [Ramlibacter humi]